MLRSTSDCSICFLPESPLQAVAGYKVCLEEGRYTWRHDSVLNVPPSTFKAIIGFSLSADFPGFFSPSGISGDRPRPYLILKTSKNVLFIVELSAGFETNLNNNADKNKANYAEMTSDSCQLNHSVRFVNLPISCLGILGQSSTSFLGMRNDL